MVGTYSAGNFSSSTVGGHVRITDPAVVNGGVEAGVPYIAFGAQTTLAYSESSTALSLGATEGRYAAALALLGNYMAASFAKRRARAACWARARQLPSSSSLC